jgi:hypothetical protein
LDLIDRVREHIKSGRYRMTLHAETERDADRIGMNEIEEALVGEKCELIEDYPKDPRGHSFLLCGFTDNGKPVHAVCSFHEDILVIITVYRPNPDLWMEWKLRRQKQ